MAFRYALKIFSKFSNDWATISPREVFIDTRQFATKEKINKKLKKDTKRCPNKTCNPNAGAEKLSIWNLFKSKPPPPKPALETCRKRMAEKIWEPDPDLSGIGGTPYKTCGTAYIIQKEVSPKEIVCVEPEDEILRKIEAHPDLKNIVDPLPPFESVEQRLLDLSEKKLHPCYKRYLSMPPRKSPQSNYFKQFAYKSRSGPISDDEIPTHLQLNKDCLNKKNIYYEFKRSEPPRQLLAKMLEISQNQRPTMEKKPEKAPAQMKPFDAKKALQRKN